MNEIPTSLKQIGNIEKGLAIYIEDYVYTFLNQYSNLDEEKLAYLVGDYKIINGQEHLFILGAIKGNYTEHINGQIVFSDRSKTYADEVQNRYFKDHEIVGWFISQPNSGTGLSLKCQEYHFNNYKKSYNVLLVKDPLEKLTSFYVYDEISNALIEKSGFMIYYDKNPNMKEYKLDLNENEQDRRNIEIKSSNYSSNKKHKNTKHKKPKQSNSHSNALAPVCAVFVILTCVFGIGLYKSNIEVESLTAQLTEVSTVLNDLYAQVNPNATEDVYTEQEVITEDTASATSVPEPEVTETTSEIESAATATATSTSTAPVATDSTTSESTTTEDTTTTENSTDLYYDNATGYEEPVDTQVSENTDEQRTYVVQEGDTLGTISEQFYGTSSMTDEIMAANGMTNDVIYAGTEIILP